MNSWSRFNADSYLARQCPSELFLGRGMLSLGEVKALFTAAADFYRGAGRIVDAGAFAGMSAHSFACGVRANPLQIAGPVIHSYDKFVADDDYVADYLRNVFYTARSAAGAVKEVLHAPAQGEDFLHVFWHQNQRYADLIRAHQGDFGQQPWNEGPIEILFVDVAKTRALHDHMLRTFMPSLLPGESILIQQDYNHVWHPYIHLAMEVLAPCFDVLVGDEAASRIYFCRELPSAALLEQAVRLDLDERQIIEAYAGIVARSRPGARRMLEVAQVKALMDAGFVDAGRRAASELRRSFGDRPLPAWMAADLARIAPEPALQGQPR